MSSRQLRRQPELPATPATLGRVLPRALQAATLLLTGLALLCLFATPIADTDFWWHLKTGQYIVETRALPLPEPFAYTSTAPLAWPGEGLVRHFNLTHEWLSQAILYLVYSLAGFPGVILSRALLLTVFCGLAGFLAARVSKNLFAGVAAACATASVAIAFTADRPALVSFLGVAVFISILETRRLYWVLPPLALLWANSHGGFPLAWVILLAYSAETLLRREWTPHSRQLWLASILAIAATGVNPNRFGIVSTILAYRASPLTANLIEWMPPRLWGQPWGFGILLLASAIVLAISWKKVRPAHWLLFAAFAAASLLAFRNIPLVGFLAPVLIAAYFPSFRPFRWKLPPYTAWAAPGLALAGLTAVIAQGGLQKLRVADSTIPAGAATYIAEHHLEGPLFNTYEQGGYLIWRLAPTPKVFIDGRALSEGIYRDYRKILFNNGSDQMNGARAELLDYYGVQTIVMNTMDSVSGALYPLTLALANPSTTGWDLVYEDTQAVVFVRHAASTPATTPATTPALPNKLGRVLRHLNRECASYIENSPEDALCARTLSEYWTHNQVPEFARRMLRLWIDHAPTPDPQAEQTLRQLEAAQNR